MLSLRRRLAPILWVVLVVGGLLTVGTLCLFNIESAPLHAAKVASAAALLSLMLFAIYQLQNPFGGGVRIEPEAFRAALERFG